MFRNKLNALEYPLASSFDCSDSQHFHNVVVWLEDQKIRKYKIEDREAIRKVNSPEWLSAFKEYLEDLKCPYSVTEDRNIILDWLLGFAVRLIYNDDATKYKSGSAKELLERRKQPEAATSISSNPLDKLNFEDEDFKTGVRTLARLLNIQDHPDHLLLIKAISNFVQERLSNSAVANAKNAASSKREEGINEPYSLEKYPLGFAVDDPVLSRASRALRLLHIHNLRQLQTQINEIIVAIQAISADPKTDERLGQVGRS